MASQASDVIVVGAGNAAFCAALAAKEQGASVVMLEDAPGLKGVGFDEVNRDLRDFFPEMGGFRWRV